MKGFCPYLFLQFFNNSIHYKGSNHSKECLLKLDDERLIVLENCFNIFQRRTGRKFDE
ncbi:hypothetical protein LEP1GSC083_1721 [Leptospira interrogans serovar Pyrogenes str. L0374]|uniref:Uncharacterized protein n=1 Tax=Leptospira interrogans serovar Pyrogenes str. L0374 TaxID=1049928 RepID=M6KMG7_LEPIR|nr:hypothetical protein LEP1GSC077_1698 [Leptospira interrogans str. C10069]EKO68200.1 hypothetical protein LEP1GSC069_1192 [Leptospira interrogans serovar Canicola str. Fiocruz LV133]EMK17766.1 hypothetical protein LEP1GSC075_0846 [Leptospira interrogans str. Kito]EMN33030.1 hypothetical protein LEP1GSC083_1721 [Leptospira interrogans serovar Pyrogenes str. L0374]EMN64015.1 hypothetical protein LEP1GSC092_0706 [Leptospira interrogans serovar Pyrogenes str. R168]EMN75061.1 hypothetical protein